MNCSISNGRFISCFKPENQTGSTIINVSVFDSEFFDFDEFVITVVPIETLEEVEPVAKELEESLQKNMLAHRKLLLNVEGKTIQFAASATRIIIINLVFILTTIIVIIIGITISFFVSRSFPKE